ncbi:MAG: HEAT repeat domain-containing protein [Acidimicrobiales bacterium]
MSEDPRLRRLACDVLGSLGYEDGQPFGAETFSLLARVCKGEDSPPVLASAVMAVGELQHAETLTLLVSHSGHEDSNVRRSVARVLPSIAGVDWLDPAHPAVTTLMELTADEDPDVRDWATFGLGTGVKADGVVIRRCLLARVQDPHEDTRAEAIAGLARRHAPEAVRFVRHDLGADAVGRLTVDSARLLGDPSLAEPLGQLVTWWDVDVELLEDARRRCDPARIDAKATLVRALLDAAELSHLSISVASELLPNDAGDPEVSVVGAGTDAAYALDALLRRAGGSVDIAIRLIRHDLGRT